MSNRGPCRRLRAAFKLKFRSDIRSGTVTRGDSTACRRTSFSFGSRSATVARWMKMYGEEGSAGMLLQYETKIAALERKAERLTMQVVLLKKAPRLKVSSSSATTAIVSGPRPVAPSAGV